MQPKLDTMADRWRYVLDGRKLKNKITNEIVGFKDGALWNYSECAPANQALSIDNWTPHHEPMTDEFECVAMEVSMYGGQVAAVVNRTLVRYIGKNVKIRIEEIIK